jgi:hypothetical protein
MEEYTYIYCNHVPVTAFLDENTYLTNFSASGPGDL